MWINDNFRQRRDQKNQPFTCNDLQRDNWSSVAVPAVCWGFENKAQTARPWSPLLCPASEEPEGGNTNQTISPLLDEGGWDYISLEHQSMFAESEECCCRCGQAAIQHFVLAERSHVTYDNEHPASEVTWVVTAWGVLVFWQDKRMSWGVGGDTRELTRTLRSRACGKKNTVLSVFF